MRLPTKLRLLLFWLKVKRRWWGLVESLPFFGKGIAERRAKREHDAYWAYMRSLPLDECFRESMRSEALRRKVTPPDPLPGGEADGK